MTSGEAPMTVDITRSRAATVSTASFSSVMSVEMVPTATGIPSGSSRGNLTDRNVWVPSARGMLSSNCIGLACHQHLLVARPQRGGGLGPVVEVVAAHDGRGLVAQHGHEGLVGELVATERVLQADESGGVVEEGGEPRLALLLGLLGLATGRDVDGVGEDPRRLRLVAPQDPLHPSPGSVEVADAELHAHLTSGLADGPAGGGEQRGPVVVVDEIEEHARVVGDGQRRVAHDAGAVRADVVDDEGRRVVEAGAERAGEHHHRPGRHQVLEGGSGLLQFPAPGGEHLRRPRQGRLGGGDLVGAGRGGFEVDVAREALGVDLEVADAAGEGPGEQQRGRGSADHADAEGDQHGDRGRRGPVGAGLDRHHRGGRHEDEDGDGEHQPTLGA